MSCYLCGCSQSIFRPGSVRDNSEIKILECTDCGLVYLSSHTHIGYDHYEKSGMHDGKVPCIASWLKDTQADDRRRYDFLETKITNKQLLDFGCGAGGFLKLAQESCSSSCGIELETALQNSYKERGLVVYPSLSDANSLGQQWDLITAFHVIEHLTDPADMISQLASLLSHGGELIIEVPSANDVLLTTYNNDAFQNFTYWSQHLYLFNAVNLNLLVKKAGLKLQWVKHIQRYPLSNHLYWLSKGKPGGHKHWDFLSCAALDLQYEQQLASLGLTDTIIASISN